MNLILKLLILAIASMAISAKCSLKGCHDVTKIRKPRRIGGSRMLQLKGNDTKGNKPKSPPDPEDSEDGSDTGEGCFSAMNIVDVYGKGAITMDSVEIGDYVRTSDNNFSRVYSFAQKNKEFEATFVQIHTSSPQSPLELTNNHMIFLDHHGMVPANTVKVGDELNSYKVNDIKIIKRRGVYAPQTESGDLLVGNILASSYVAVLNKSPVLFINQHNLGYILCAPHRLMCFFSFSLCEKETYTKEEGYSTWSVAIIKFLIVLKDTSPLIQTGVALFLFPIFFLVYILEQLLVRSEVMIILLPLVIFHHYKTTTLRNNSKTKTL